MKNSLKKRDINNLQTSNKYKPGAIYGATSPSKSISGFGDYEIQENIKKLKQQQKNENINKLKEQEKQRRVKLTDFHKLILVTYLLLIVGTIVTLVFKKFDYSFYCVLLIVGSIYLNKRLKFNDINLELVNLLLWQMTNSFYDFIKYQISNKLLENYKSILTKCNIIFMLIILIVPSSNIIFLFSFIALISSFILAFANKDFEIINEKINFLLIMSLFGFFIKFFMPLIFFEKVYIDLGVIILINILVTIDFFTKNIRLHPPIIESADDF